MKGNHVSHRQSLAGLLAASIIVVAGGCGGESAASPSPPSPSGISPRKFVDAVHAVMMADRTVYAQKVVTRLQQQKAPVEPSEYWENEEHTIPLPAQMFRMGAELVSENKEAGFTYALKSKWALNKQNTAKTDVEIEGIEYLIAHPDENYYTEEKLGDKTYYTAFYADKAVAQACWDCHNNHSNREDSFPEFKEGDVMGAVIVRVPLD
jgi:hypothetical protein